MTSLEIRAIAALVCSVLLFTIGFYSGFRWEESAVLKLQNAVLAANAKAEAAHSAKQAAVVKVATKDSASEGQAQDKIVTVTRTIIQKVPEYVTIYQDQHAAAADGPGCVTYGFVRLLYGAERGVDPARLALPAGQSDDACTGYGLSDLAAALASDYGTARQNSEQLNGLIADVKAQSAAISAP